MKTRIQLTAVWLTALAMALPQAGLAHGSAAGGTVQAERFHETGTTVANGELPATLTVPVGSGPFPAVVLVHGSGPGDRDQSLGPNRPFRDIAHGLATRGIVTLRYDKRTRVRPGEFAGSTFTVEEETVADAVLAVDELRRIDAVDASRVHVLGLSLGAMLAPRIAARTRPAGMILVSAPARPLHELILEQVTYIASLDPDAGEVQAASLAEIQRQHDAVAALDPSSPSGAPFGVPASYWLDLRDYDPVEAARGLDVPLILLHGGRDYQVTEVDFGRWATAFEGDERALLYLFEDLNHLMMAGEERATPQEYLREGRVHDAAIDHVAQWVLER